jgi:MoxR-like ATPase
LPEAQLDRFIFKLEVKAADVETLREIIFSRRHGEPPAAAFNVSAEELDALFSIMNRIYLPGPVAEYIARLVNATNPTSNTANRMVKEFVQYGASPRAAIAVAETARGVALLAGRPSVGFEDVREVLVPALNHRVLLNYKARFEGLTTATLLEEIKKSIKETDLGLTDELVVEAESK